MLLYAFFGVISNNRIIVAAILFPIWPPLDAIENDCNGFLDTENIGEDPRTTLLSAADKEL